MIRGQSLSLKTIVVLILLLVTLLALVLFFQHRFSAMVANYDILFGKAEQSIDLIPAMG